MPDSCIYLFIFILLWNRIVGIGSPSHQALQYAQVPVFYQTISFT